MFKALNLFKTTLTSVLEPGGATLPILSAEAAKVCEAINDGACIPCATDPEPDTGESDWTYLVLFHNGYNEIVKVTGCVGGTVLIERGKENTTPRRFPVGTCVQFIWTAAAVQCAVATVTGNGNLSNHIGDCKNN